MSELNKYTAFTAPARCKQQNRTEFRAYQRKSLEGERQNRVTFGIFLFTGLFRKNHQKRLKMSQIFQLRVTEFHLKSVVELLGRHPILLAVRP